MLQSSQIMSLTEKQLYALKNLPAHLCSCLSKDRLFQLLTDIPFLEAKINLFSIYEIEIDLRLALQIYLRNSQEYKSLSILEKYSREHSHIINKAPQVFFNLLSDYLDSEINLDWALSLRAKIKQTKIIHNNRLSKTRELLFTQSRAKQFIMQETPVTVTAMAATTDGHCIVLTTENSKIIIWNLHEEESEFSLDDSEFEITALKITQDNGKIIAGTKKGIIYIWDLNEKRLIRRLSESEAEVQFIAILEDGKRMLTGHPGLIQEWDLEIGKFLGKYLESTMFQYIDFIDADQLFVVSHDIFDTFRKDTTSPHFIIQEIISGNMVHQMNSSISSVAQTSDHSKIIIACHDAPICVIDCENWQVSQTLDTKKQSISKIACMPGDSQIVTGSYHGELSLWNINNGELLCSVEGSSDEIIALCIYPSGDYVFASSKNGEILAWDIEKRQVSHLGFNELPFEKSKENCEVKSLAIVAHNTLLVASLKNGLLPVWDIAGGKQIGSLRGHLLPVNVIASMANEEMVVTGSEDGSVRIWRMNDGRLISSIETGFLGVAKAKIEDSDIFVGSSIEAIATSHDSRLIIYGTNDGMIYVHDMWTNQDGYLIRPGCPVIPKQVMWKMKGISKDYDEFLEKKVGELLPEDLAKTNYLEEYYREYKTHNVGKIQSLAIDHGNKIIASTGIEDGSIKIWNVNSKQLLQSYEYGKPLSYTKVFALAIDSESKKIISVSDGEVDEGGIIWQWNIDSGNLISSIKLPYRLSTSIISDDQNYVVSAFVNGILCITDLHVGKTVPLYGEDAPIRSIAISSDLDQIFCGYENGRVNVFQLNNLDISI